jgi:hypothetical protein
MGRSPEHAASYHCLRRTIAHRETEVIKIDGIARLSG